MSLKFKVSGHTWLERNYLKQKKKDASGESTQDMMQSDKIWEEIKKV